MLRLYLKFLMKLLVNCFLGGGGRQIGGQVLFGQVLQMVEGLQLGIQIICGLVGFILMICVGVGVVVWVVVVVVVLLLVEISVVGVIIIFCCGVDFSVLVCWVMVCRCCIEFIILCGWVKNVLLRFFIQGGFLFIIVSRVGKVIRDLMLGFYGWLVIVCMVVFFFIVGLFWDYWIVCRMLLG